MKFKKKNILLASGAIITAAASATAIVYSNVQKTKALSPLLIPGIALGFGFAWLFATFDWYEGDGYQEIDRMIELSEADVYYKSNNVYSKIPAVAKGKLTYNYQPRKNEFFRQDYVGWKSKIETYVEALSGKKITLPELEQILVTEISGIGSPTLDATISTDRTLGFSSSFSLNGKTLTETLSTTNSPILRSESENKAWIWTYWGFNQYLRAKYKAKTISYTLLSSKKDQEKQS